MVWSDTIFKCKSEETKYNSETAFIIQKCHLKVRYCIWKSKIPFYIQIFHLKFRIFNSKSGHTIWIEYFIWNSENPFDIQIFHLTFIYSIWNSEISTEIQIFHILIWNIYIGIHNISFEIQFKCFYWNSDYTTFKGFSENTNWNSETP